MPRDVAVPRVGGPAAGSEEEKAAKASGARGWGLRRAAVFTKVIIDALDAVCKGVFHSRIGTP